MNSLYELSHSFYRAINPHFRNSEDVVEVALCLDTLKNNDRSSVQQASSLHKKVSSHYFLSSELKEKLSLLETYIMADKIAKKLDLDYQFLLEHPEDVAFISKNHLHNKISQQHKECGLGIKIDDGVLKIPVAGEGKTTWLSREEICTKFPTKNGKVIDGEFLADGFQVHSAKKWETLKPLYALKVEDGNYIHIDTLTGKKEIIGKEGHNYIQLVTVKPWGYNPKGGALFGHTWIRFVIDGKLYHVGANLQGEILNPDFMATVPRDKKVFSTTSWSAIDDSVKDQFGKTVSERIILKLEALQQFLHHNKVPEECPYTDEIVELYHVLRTEHGGTCTSASAMMYKEVTGINYVESARPLAARVVFNPLTNRILNVIWRYTPKPIAKTFVQPVQIVTRGAHPNTLSKKIK